MQEYRLLFSLSFLLRLLAQFADHVKFKYSPFGGKNLKFSAKDAVLSQGIPNFLFHVTTGYSILRAKGVPLGKSDYIRNFIGQ